CPCGWYGSQQHPCTCSRLTLQLYQKRLSGPLLDRIDLFGYVMPVPIRSLAEHDTAPSPSTPMRQRVIDARIIQKEILKPTKKIVNAELDTKEIQSCIILAPAA